MTTHASEDTSTTPSYTFEELGLHPGLVGRLARGGYQAPTPIQAQTIPALLEGRDVIGQAQTGTGKTAAFSLPMIQQLDIGKRKVQGLILCPTRELALQVTDALESYGESHRVRVLTVYGGTPIHKQISKLKSGVHVVVGTPGRVKDCLSRGALKLGAVRHVVLDEADEMLRMGFIDDVEEILGQVPSERQTALFSATMPPAIQRIAESHLESPVTVKIDPHTRTVDRIEQRFLITPAHEKVNVLARLVEAEPSDLVLVFARTRMGCANLVESLQARGLNGRALHGDLSQDQREAIVRELRDRRIQLVVATDVAARGLDVDGITHVINYDPPAEADVYVHRIGRTGRAGRKGIAITLLTPRERHFRRNFEKHTGHRMRETQVPTNEEILAGRIARFRARVQETISDGDLDPYRKVVDDLLAQPDSDPRDIAAALARLATGDRPFRIVESAPTPMPESKGKDKRKDKRSGRRDRPREAVFIFVPLGFKAGVTPADLLGAVINEGKVPADAVGTIDVREKVSFIEVEAVHVASIISRMARVTMRGRPTTFSIARPGSYERGRPKPPPRKHRKGIGKGPGKGPGGKKRARPDDAPSGRKFRKKR